MKNLLRVAAVCGLALLTVNSGAWAQQTHSKNQVNGTAFKLGFFNPGSGPARQGGGTQILSAEADLVIQYIPERSETGVVSIGYIERDNLRIIPITLSQLTHDKKQTSNYDYYHGYGIGIYSARLNIGGVNSTSGETKTLIGAHAVLGLNLSESTFIEAKYLYPGRYDNQFIGGLQIMFGRRM